MSYRGAVPNSFEIRPGQRRGGGYLVFDGRPDPDGVMRKSMKKASSWRRVPIHTTLIRHGFVDFLLSQQVAGFQRPFEKEWKAREVKSELGQIIKWSHYISRWEGRELVAVAAHQKNSMPSPSPTFTRCGIHSRASWVTLGFPAKYPKHYQGADTPAPTRNDMKN
jgi:hypothetical protein